MKRFAVLALPALAVALGFMAMSATQDSASAQVVEAGPVSIVCEQTVDPVDNDGIGEVTCTLTVDVGATASLSAINWSAGRYLTWASVRASEQAGPRTGGDAGASVASP
jgi:hypothetical protein